MNEEQLKRMYEMTLKMVHELRTDRTDCKDVDDALNELKTVILKEFRDLVWGEYWATELKHYNT